MKVVDLDSRRPDPGMARLRRALARLGRAVEAREGHTQAWRDLQARVEKTPPE